MTRRVIVLDTPGPTWRSAATLEAGLELVDASGLDRAELLPRRRGTLCSDDLLGPVDAG
jgi:hypothetical protein